MIESYNTTASEATTDILSRDDTDMVDTESIYLENSEKTKTMDMASMKKYVQESFPVLWRSDEQPDIENSTDVSSACNAHVSQTNENWIRYMYDLLPDKWAPAVLRQGNHDGTSNQMNSQRSTFYVFDDLASLQENEDTWADLFACTQQDGESVVDYGNRVTGLARRLIDLDQP